LAICDWDAATTADRTSSHARAHGELLDLAPGDGGQARLTIGESTTEAVHGGPSSDAESRSEGARIDLGQSRVFLVLLHSESASDNSGSVYLASLNGREVVPSSGRDEHDSVTVPLITTLAVLHRDATGAVIGSVSDGRSQRVIGVGSTWAGHPSADPQPLR